ncbi:MAG TPA: peroxiredoxin [Solirubrobacterales bacterium]|nr:peroxiredoxin [Solirubrobacterales bacterium]
MAKVDVGDPAPEFELPGTGSRTYRLSDLRGQWVVLAFYPGDFTPVCTRQFCSYRDGDDHLDQLGVEVLGISPQSVDSHERFRRKHGLTQPLLADEGREVLRSYGVLAPGGIVRRSIFIVDPEGMVRFRHVALLGLHFKDVNDLSEALAGLR